MMARARLVFLFPCLVALVAALWSGLARLGWGVDPVHPAMPGAHGPLMVSGFLGALICLERAVALGDRRGYAVPGLAGVGGIAVAAGLEGVGQGLLAAAGAGLAGLYLVMIRRRSEPFLQVMLAGALAWLIGNLLWLSGRPIFQLVPWWMGFLVLTIAGERLELNRLVKPSPGSRASFFGAVAVLLVGIASSLVVPSVGVRVLGVGLVALALWLLRFDVARRTVRQRGLPRFVAVCLLSGYFWLGVGGLLAIVRGELVPGPWYDAMLHCVFVGFVFAMIFGHAPIIVPALLRVSIPFRPVFYGHLGMLHLSLAVRVVGDLLPWWPGRLWGGLLNEAAVVIFAVNMVLAARAGRAKGVTPARSAR